MNRRRSLTYSFVSLLLSCLAPRVSHAHPIHTTMTAVSADKSGITFSVRSFADDFSASVALFAGRKPPTDSSVTEHDVASYLAAHLRVLDARGQALTLRSCGTTRARELYWLCVRVDGPTDVRVLRVENRILTERHADQVNIVQVDASGVRKTILFTKRSQALPLSG